MAKETKRSGSTAAVKEKQPVESKTEKATEKATPSTATKSTTDKVISVTELSNVPQLELLHAQISQCAYFLWEKEGYQPGRENEYWLRAEEIVSKESKN